jgi:hypothetical protein
MLITCGFAHGSDSEINGVDKVLSALARRYSPDIIRPTIILNAARAAQCHVPDTF